MKNLRKYSLEKPVKPVFLYLIGILAWMLAFAAGIALGGTTLDAGSVWQDILDGSMDSADSKIFLFVRLPRTLAALLCGGALAVAGGVIQGVLANRLASPSVIGVNAGAGLAITVCTALGLYGGWQVSGFAFLGAFLAVLTVSLLARKWNASKGTVILLGVAMNSLLGAFSDSIVTLIPTVGVMSNDFKVGEFTAITWPRLFPAAVLIGVAVIVLLTLGNDLDVLSLGEDTARGLGMHTGRMRTLFLLLAALLSGCAVSLAGLLSFVGLMVPHVVRRFSGSRSLHLMGLCALFGGAFVCLCDTLARTLFAPYEIPVGILMAFLGAPFFVMLLFSRKGGLTGA